ALTCRAVLAELAGRTAGGYRSPELQARIGREGRWRDVPYTDEGTHGAGPDGMEAGTDRTKAGTDRTKAGADGTKAGADGTNAGADGAQAGADGSGAGRDGPDGDS